MDLWAHVRAGLYDEVERRAGAEYELQLGNPTHQELGPLAAMLATAANDRGRLADSLHWYRRSEDHFRDALPLFGWIAINGTILAAAQLGDLETARAAEERLAGCHFPGLEFAAGIEGVALGWLRVQEGDTHAARALWSATAIRGVEAGDILATVDALHGLARAGLVDDMPVDIEDLRGLVNGQLITAKCDYIAARLANDPERLEKAADAFAAMGCYLFAAEAYFDAGRAYRRAGDPRRATLVGRTAVILAADCQGAKTPALRSSDETVPLTDRERELALLAADGLSTKEIAERLFLSHRTVQNHLNRAYEKLGVSGRRELRQALKLPGSS
jgi:DNA-binding CsgD family transcriptional regulator